MEQHEIWAAQTFSTGNSVLLASISLGEPPLYWNYSYFMKLYFAFYWELKSLILELNFDMIGLQSQTKSKIFHTSDGSRKKMSVHIKIHFFCCDKLSLTVWGFLWNFNSISLTLFPWQKAFRKKATFFSFHDWSFFSSNIYLIYFCFVVFSQMFSAS